MVMAVSGGSRDRKNSGALWFPACLLAIICCSRQTLQSCADGTPSPVDCYECSSHGNDAHFCADPFNRTHPSIRTTTCLGPCVKWLKKPPNGPAQYIRTCSTNLYLRISVALVCMQESRPGDGQLCFCQRDRCNSLPSMHDPTSHARTATLVLCLVVSLLASVFSIPTRSVVSGTYKTASETLEAASAIQQALGTKLKESPATSKTSSVTANALSSISKQSSANLDVLSVSQKESSATAISSSVTPRDPFARSKVSSAVSKALAVTSNVTSVTIKALSATLLSFTLLSSVKESSLLSSSSAYELQSTCQKHVTAMNFQKQII